MKGFLQSEDGVTAIEYGLIAALIAIGLITFLGAVGTSLQTTFDKVSKALNG